ncbi:acyl carrier protein [Burkholderia glumae]|uniref:acyl carrier protein n=1 Tax=Burkholderia glumae TaxID=337 RepID=UPI002151B03B|nr:acyl carrier protein [Burkholderia glumae]UVS97929.1 acyl carrier protein [Burkholderia glumae]
MKTEAILIQVLEDVIGVKNVTPYTRFPDIGGNSLNLVEVLKRMKAQVGVTPPPRQFFDRTRSSVAELAAATDALREASRNTADAAS